MSATIFGRSQDSRHSGADEDLRRDRVSLCLTAIVRDTTGNSSLCVYIPMNGNRYIILGYYELKLMENTVPYVSTSIYFIYFIYFILF